VREELRGNGRKKEDYKTPWRIAWAILLFAVWLLAWVWLWTIRIEGRVHYRPRYEKQPLSAVLEKEFLQANDYAFLFSQTGMGKSGVDALREEGRAAVLYELQEAYFSPVESVCERTAPFLRTEYINGRGAGSSIPVLESGDILVTFSGHFLGWRNGHAAIVTDAVKRKTAEAVAIGVDSRISTVKGWEEYPTFAILRLKGASKEERSAIGAYAETHLTGLPYNLLSFLDESGAMGTQCAHLVWMAYRKFGYNIDGNGGLWVTPADICKSPLLEVVQIYGLRYR
jgi:hypothetical protein